MTMVSVIVTVYNVEKYIDRCIKSILRQTYGNFELLVVNDGTPDNSMSIVKSYMKNDNRIRIVDYGNNVGLMWARRRGYLEAQGDYVFFVDSDDAIPENALSVLVKKAEESNADIIAGQGLHHLCNGLKKEIPLSLPYGDDSQGLFKALTSYAYPHYVWGKLYKRELLIGYEYTYFDKLTNAEDYALTYQLAEHIFKVDYTNEVVYDYYQNMESSSQVKLSDWQLECDIMVFLFILHKLSNSSIKKDIYRSTQRAIARFYAKGYNKDGLITHLLHKYGESDLLSFSNIMRYNNLKDSMICLIGKSKVGYILYKYIR